VVLERSRKKSSFYLRYFNWFNPSLLIFLPLPYRRKFFRYFAKQTYGIQLPYTPTSFARTHKDEAISSRTLRITAAFLLYIYSGIMRIALGLFWHLTFQIAATFGGFREGLAKDVEKAVLGSIRITQQSNLACIG